MKRLLAALVAAGVCVFGAQLYAHHSFEATYVEDRAVTIEGELVQVLFRNPHSFVRLTVTEEDGSMARYAVEWGGAGQLGGQGVTSETLKLGRPSSDQRKSGAQSVGPQSPHDQPAPAT